MLGFAARQLRTVFVDYIKFFINRKHVQTRGEEMAQALPGQRASVSTKEIQSSKYKLSFPTRKSLNIIYSNFLIVIHLIFIH